MDKKRIIKNILFVVFVPAILVGAYYGYKYGKLKYEKWKAKKESNTNNQ